MSHNVSVLTPQFRDHPEDPVMSMPDLASNWMLYSALAAGAVGAIAGLVAVAVSHAALKRQAQARALDLRLKLGKLESDLLESIKELPRTMQRAERSNLTLATSSGVRQTSSSALQKELDEDFAVLGALEAAVPTFGGDYSGLTLRDLEARVLSAYQWQSKVQRLDGKYRTVLIKDHNRRLQLADDRRVLLEAKLRGSHN
jgi:hypothetical protein